MRMIIHDLDNAQWQSIAPAGEETIIVAPANEIAHCIGCFGCWVKTPAACVIRDAYGDMGENLAKCSEVMIISKCCYGSYSPFVKNVLDRSISYVHPYFQIKNGEMHHRERYSSHFELSVWFYGENITQREKQTAEKLVRSNAVNFSAKIKTIRFAQDITEIGGKLS